MVSDITEVIDAFARSGAMVDGAKQHVGDRN
jgi:hypothetical protein